MKTEIPRVLIENSGEDQDNFNLALTEALRAYQDLKCNQLTLLVPSKNAPIEGLLDSYLGEQDRKKLYSGKPITNNNINFDLHSYRTFQHADNHEIILALYLPHKGVDIIDSINRAKTIVFLPLMEEEARGWQSTWTPKVVGANTWNNKPLPVHAEVEKKLQEIIKMPAGLNNPSDKSNALRELHSLKGQNFLIEEESIRQWTLRNSWQPNDARALAKLVKRCIK